jgi:hypothetical protein
VWAVGVVAGLAGFLLLVYGVGALLLLACVAAFGIRGWRLTFGAGWITFGAGWITGLVIILVLTARESGRT